MALTRELTAPVVDSGAAAKHYYLIISINYLLSLHFVALLCTKIKIKLLFVFKLGDTSCMSIGFVVTSSQNGKLNSDLFPFQNPATSMIVTSSVTG